MADPFESPEGETPIERRQRLLNLTNEAWEPATGKEQLQEPVEPAAPVPPARSPAPTRSAKE